MLDSYQKFADSAFGTDTDWFTSRGVHPQDVDEVRVAFALCIYEGGLDYADNFRVARVGDKQGTAAYHERKRQGCCGYFDSQVKCLSGRIYWIGCNYGH